MKSILTTGQNVASEAVVVDGVTAEKFAVDGVGNVTIAEGQVAAVKDLATGGQTLADVLKAAASTKFSTVTANVNVADAIALGLVATNDLGVMVAKNPDVKVSGNALSSGSDVAIAVNVAKPAGSNAVIKYTLLGSENGTDFSEVSGYTDRDTVPTIPASIIGTGSGKYLFFKVKVSVTIRSASPTASSAWVTWSPSWRRRPDAHADEQEKQGYRLFNV